jgi:hypothetical protein
MANKSGNKQVSDEGTGSGDSCPGEKPGKTRPEKAARGKAAAGKVSKEGKPPVGKKAPPKKLSQAQVVKDLLRNAAVKLKKKDSRPSLGEYIRLLQLQKELEAEEPREIRVRWVESEPTFGIAE